MLYNLPLNNKFWHGTVIDCTVFNAVFNCISVKIAVASADPSMLSWSSFDSLPNNKILDWSKLKAVADNKYLTTALERILFSSLAQWLWYWLFVEASLVQTLSRSYISAMHLFICSFVYLLRTLFVRWRLVRDWPLSH